MTSRRLGSNLSFEMTGHVTTKNSLVQNTYVSDTESEGDDNLSPIHLEVADDNDQSIDDPIVKLVMENKVDELRRLKYAGWNNERAGGTLLQVACEHGRDEVVKFLLQEKLCNPNTNFYKSEDRKSEQLSQRPVLVAILGGHHKVLAVFKTIPNVDWEFANDQKENILHRALVGLDKVDASYNCLSVLLSGEKSIPEFEKTIDQLINKEEEYGNTPLHYATIKGDRRIIKLLLGRRANMGLRNDQGFAPAERIPPETIEDFLTNDCIKEDGLYMKPDYKITFKYDFLAPPNTTPKVVVAQQDAFEASQQTKSTVAGSLAGTHPTDQSQETQSVSLLKAARQERTAVQLPEAKMTKAAAKKEAKPETEAIWHLSKASKEHRALLRHPVIASYLWMKWERIYWPYFFLPLIPYILYICLFTPFILIRFGGCSLPTNNVGDVCNSTGNNSDEAVNLFNGSSKGTTFGLAIGVYISLVMLLLSELLLMLACYKRYFTSPKNYVELFLIIISWYVLTDEDDSHFQGRRNVASICLLLAWLQMIFLFVRQPRFNIYLNMFSRIAWNYLKVLFWYAGVIVAFGLSFYIMFHRDHTGRYGQRSVNATFDHWATSLGKGVPMSAGEIDDSNIPMAGHLLGRPLVLSFIFIVVFVLMNQLTGMAVGDVEAIRAEAEVFALVSLADQIAFVEAALRKDFYRFIPCWSIFSYSWVYNMLPGWLDVFLFYPFQKIQKKKNVTRNQNEGNNRNREKSKGTSAKVEKNGDRSVRQATFCPHDHSDVPWWHLGYKIRSRDRHGLVIPVHVLKFASKLLLGRKAAEEAAREAMELEQLKARTVKIMDMMVDILENRSFMEEIPLRLLKVKQDFQEDREQASLNIDRFLDTTTVVTVHTESV